MLGLEVEQPCCQHLQLQSIPVQCMSSNLLYRKLPWSQIQKCIPKKWKPSRVSVTKFEGQVSSNAPSASEFSGKIVNLSDESMADYLAASVRDFAKQGKLVKALRAYAQVKSHAVSCTVSCDGLVAAASSLILSCMDRKALRQGTEIHAHVVCLGLERHPIFVPKLLSFYTSFDLVEKARIVIERSGYMRTLPWNMLISAYVRNGLYDEAISAYGKMMEGGVRPDDYTFPSILKACGELKDLDYGRRVHRLIYTTGFESCLYVQNALVAMYDRCEEVDLSRKVFDQMVEKDEVAWNTMISCYAFRGMWQEAFRLFENMKATCAEVPIITWNIIAQGCSKLGNFSGALEVISQVRKSGLCLDFVAILAGLGACSNIGAINLGKEIHGCAVRGCLDEIDKVRNSLITMYAKCKDLRHAHILFQSVEVKSIVTWNSLLTGYTLLDMSEDAAMVLRRMMISGVEPNYVTFASVLPLCARVANLQHGKEYHCYILKRKMFEEHLLLWNSLVDMYARSGKVIAARRVFDSLNVKDEFTYTSLISGYGMHGEGSTAVKLFEEMEEQHIRVDHVAMIAVLSACSHAGLVKEGQFLFEKMQTVYGISPLMEHFDCMVDMYGRAGHLNKASDIMRNMPFRPNAIIWATLLGACRIHKNMEIGEWAAGKLLDMKPDHSGYYVLIANMYAAAGCWDKLAEVRVHMRDLEMKRDAGCTWVDVGSGFSSFYAEDTSNLQFEELYPMLDVLAYAMKPAPYAGGEESASDDEILDERMICNLQVLC